MQLSFALPQDLLSADTVLMIDAGFLCTELSGAFAIPREPSESDECGNGARIGRWLPAP